MDENSLATLIYIWISLENSSNSNSESTKLENELAEPTPPLNFQIRASVELLTVNLISNRSNSESGNYGLTCFCSTVRT